MECILSRHKPVDVQPARTARESSPIVKADFLPPGLSSKELPESDGEITTYFLHTEKRGISSYLAIALKHFQSGFRGVIVSRASLVFDKANARLAGRKTGDHFEEGVNWVKSNVLKELDHQHLLTGGGTPQEKDRTARKFLSTSERIEKCKSLLAKLEKDLEEASIEMVLRFGKQSLLIEGITYVPSYAPGDKVYWLRRPSGPV